MIESPLMKAQKHPPVHTVAVVIPCNSFANRQRCIGFFREAATDRRISAFHFDSFFSGWYKNLAQLARQTPPQVIVTSLCTSLRVQTLIRELHLRTKLLVIDDLDHPKSHPLHIDDAAIGHAAAEFFTTRGYRHLAYVSSYFNDKENVHSLRRLESFRCAARAAQSEVVGVFQSKTQHFATTELQTFLENLPKPCGIFTYNDRVGRDLLNFCRLNGFAVPDAFSIVGVDNDEAVCEASVPSLSSVELDFAAIGRAACRLVLDGPAAGKQLVPTVRPTVYERGSTQSTKSYGRVVSLAQSLIRQHKGRIKANELAKLTHVTLRTLQLGFRSVLGKRPGEVILDYRLNRAKELLTTTDRPIAEIAAIAGFSATNDLYRRFSERYGLSPTEYRRELLNG